MLTASLMLALLTPSPAWSARAVQEPQTAPAASQDAREELQEILDEFDDAYNAFLTAYRAANEADRNKVYEEQYPDANAYAERILAVAQRHKGTDVAFDAYAWVASRTQGEPQKLALDALVADHFQSEKMGDIVFAFPQDDAGRALLSRLIEENPHRAVKGLACYALANQYAPPYDARQEWTTRDEYVATLRRIQSEFADVEMRGNKLGPMAEGGLFEVEHLQTGMAAPDIVGEDLAGVPFQLSDYKGKVIMLDFWGHW